MSARINRRALTAGILLATAAPAIAKDTRTVGTLRGDDTARLPNHAALWARMPLPFTPAEAWHLLSPATQAEIGAAVIGMELAQYVYGDGRSDADQFTDDTLRSDASDVSDAILNAMPDRLWTLLPDLYGPDGDHPAWALAAGMVHPLGAVVPERDTLSVTFADEPDPAFAAIEAASAAEADFIAALDALPDDPTDAQSDAAEQVGFASDRVNEALLSTRPTTLDGLVAQLRYLGQSVINDGGRGQIVRFADLLANGPPIG